MFSGLTGERVRLHPTLSSASSASRPGGNTVRLDPSWLITGPGNNNITRLILTSILTDPGTTLTSPHLTRRWWRQGESSERPCLAGCYFLLDIYLGRLVAGDYTGNSPATSHRYHSPLTTAMACCHCNQTSNILWHPGITTVDWISNKSRDQLPVGNLRRNNLPTSPPSRWLASWVINGSSLTQLLWAD